MSSDKEIEKLCGRKFLEKFIKNTIFSSHIENIFHISQYCINNKLITLFGEYHTVEHISKKLPYYKPLSEFVGEKLQENEKSKILLEFGPYTSTPDKIGSSNINMIYKKTIELNLIDRIIPFDFRFNCIDIHDYFKYILIPNPYFEKLPTEVIYHKFIKPFFEKNDFFANELVIRSDDNPHFMGYLKSEYYPGIYRSFHFIHQELKKIQEKEEGEILDLYFKNMDEIRIAILTQWMKVADFFILKSIFKTDDIDEYIILMGDSHRKHLEDVLNQFTKLSNKKDGSTNGLYFAKSHYYKKLL